MGRPARAGVAAGSLTIRVTLDERSTLEAAAARAGVLVGGFVRAAALAAANPPARRKGRLQ